jgi:hypothetical protein
MLPVRLPQELVRLLPAKAEIVIIQLLRVLRRPSP